MAERASPRAMRPTPRRARLVGSSSSSSSGSGSSACASSTRRSSPPESTASGRRSRPGRPTRSSSAAIARRVGGAMPEADRPPLARQREKIVDRDRQRRIDGEALRHVADRARARPVQHDAAVERDLAEHRRQQRALAGAVRPDDRRAADAARTRSDTSSSSASRLRRDGEHARCSSERIGRPRVGHPSVTSARIIVSTFRCISRSNLSAVYVARGDVRDDVDLHAGLVLQHLQQRRRKRLLAEHDANLLALQQLAPCRAARPPTASARAPAGRRRRPRGRTPAAGSRSRRARSRRA